MATDAMIERRLEAVEHGLAELQQKLAVDAPNPDWLKQITGSFRDEPAFEEVLEFGRSLRSSHRIRFEEMYAESASEEKSEMATQQITLEIDADTAEAFAKMPQGGKKTIERLLGMRLRSLVAHANESLSDVMDEVGRKAQGRGLTPEILESILNEHT